MTEYIRKYFRRIYADRPLWKEISLGCWFDENAREYNILMKNEYYGNYYSITFKYNNYFLKPMVHNYEEDHTLQPELIV